MSEFVYFTLAQIDTVTRLAVEQDMHYALFPHPDYNTLTEPIPVFINSRHEDFILVKPTLVEYDKPETKKLYKVPHDKIHILMGIWGGS